MLKARLNYLINLKAGCDMETQPLFFLPVNSKAEVRFHLASADWIPEAVRQNMALMVPALPFQPWFPWLCQNMTVPTRFQWSHHVFPSLQHKNKINRAGELIVTSEESRYQMRNLAICLEKIRTMVTEATEKPKVVSKETTQKLIERYFHLNGRYLGSGYHIIQFSLQHFKTTFFHTPFNFLF